MQLLVTNYRDLRWFYRDGEKLADIYYSFAGGLSALGHDDLAMVSARVALASERKRLFRAVCWHFLFHRAMDREKWADLSVMYEYSRIDRSRGRRLLSPEGA